MQRIGQRLATLLTSLGLLTQDDDSAYLTLDALRKANETSYFKGPDAVWVKLVIPTAPKGVGRDQFGPLDIQTSISVSR